MSDAEDLCSSVSDLEEETKPDSEVNQGPTDHQEELAPSSEQIVSSSSTPRFPSRRIFSKHGAFPCHICNTEPSKYKFRCCRFGYCSSACYAKHQAEGNCQPSATNDHQEPLLKKRSLNPLEMLDIPEEDIIPDDKLEALRTNKDILGFLSHAKLRKIIARIDSSRDRISALERQMQIDPEFARVAVAFAEAVGRN